MPWLMPLMGAPPQNGDGGGGGLMSMVFMLLMIFAIFYFLLIMPQRKAQKAREKMLSEIKKGDEVVTSGGIVGTVVGLKNGIVILKVDDSTRLRVQKSAINSIVNPGG